MMYEVETVCSVCGKEYLVPNEDATVESLRKELGLEVVESFDIICPHCGSN